jgi:RNA polymerase-associated protein
MTLFSDAQCPYCHRVRMVLAEKKMTVDIVNVNAQALPDEVLDLNPYGTVPTLVDRELRLYESSIIMEYLDERFPHPPLMPIDPVTRAHARLFMYRINQDWYSLMIKIIRGNAQEAEQARQALRSSLLETVPVFAANHFFMNEDFSLIDCIVAPLLWRLPLLKVSLPSSAYPIHEYANRVFGWPSFQQSLSEFEQDMVAKFR